MIDMSEAKPGDVICRAGRSCKCVYKRNTLFLGGQVKGNTCALKADWKTCKWAGEEVK